MSALRVGSFFAVAVASAGSALLVNSLLAEPSANPGTVVPGRPPIAFNAKSSIPMTGNLEGANDISGVGFAGELMFLVSDETAHIEILRKAGDAYTVANKLPLGEPGTEIDLEAIAVDSGYVYTIASHSRVRPKQKPKETYADNREKMETVLAPGDRDVLARFRPNPDGTPGPVEKVSLRSAIQSDPVLRPFAQLPSKENGVDIEGLAVKGPDVYVGFRGPVLRENYVPVMKTRFADGAAHELRFVNLGGRGVRDLAAVKDGFLILAGPSGDGPGSFQIYFWDGNDCLAGAAPEGKCQLLAEVTPIDKGKPEGLAVTAEDATGYDVVMVCDGVTNGTATAYRLTKVR